MFELPLFPLNTVLFPHTPVHLHIFEPRYLQMIGECIEGRQPFGVVLIQRGREALGPLAEPHRVGCTAEITREEKLPQGRLNIIAVGRERFRILSLDEKSHSYLVGMLEPYPLEIGDPGALKEAALELRPWVERYLRILAMSEAVSVESRELPADPLELAYLGAAILQSSPIQKQSLLEAKDASQLFAGLLAMVRREIAFLQSMQSKNNVPGQGSFSKN